MPPRVTIYPPGSLRQPRGHLPDAQSELDLGFRLSEQDKLAIRTGMQIHAASRAPKLTWSGWHLIATAVAVGAEYCKKAAHGYTDTPDYTRAMSTFLKRTGFTFLNKDDRACAVRMLPRWSEIDEWRSTLSRSRQAALNNPREVEEAFKKERRPLAHFPDQEPPGRRLPAPAAQLRRTDGGARRAAAISFRTTNHLHRCLAATEIQKLPSFSMTEATKADSGHIEA